MNADGSNLRKIDTARPNLPDRVSFPSWSPNDDRIAFSTADAQSSYYISSVWVVNRDGGGLHRVVYNGLGSSWSPGGRRIAYYDVHETRGSSIHVIRPDGTDDRVAAAPGAYKSFFGPSWSPDGERLVFAVKPAPDSNPGPSGLGIIHDYGARPRFLLQGYEVYQPAWSPSGREIAFVENGIVSLLNLRTTEVKPLQPGFSPTWSPDGRRIAFARGFFGSIYVMNRNGSRVRLLLQGS